MSRPPDEGLALQILLAPGLFGSAVASIISSRFSRPIRTLAQEADHIGRDAGSVMLPHVSGSMEITQLSNALRSLLRRLDLTQQEKTEVEEKSAAEAQRLNQDIDTLRELADTDPLTGLPNRRGIAAVGEEVLATFSRTGSPFSVLILDIDHFKSINDAFGHPAGDDVIRHVNKVVSPRFDRATGPRGSEARSSSPF